MPTIRVRREGNNPVQDRRLAKVLRMVREGRWTLRRAAAFAGLTYYELLDKITECGIDSGPSLEELRKVTRRKPKHSLSGLIGKKPLAREELSENG